MSGKTEEEGGETRVQNSPKAFGKLKKMFDYKKNFFYKCHLLKTSKGSEQ